MFLTKNSKYIQQNAHFILLNWSWTLIWLGLRRFPMTKSELVFKDQFIGDVGELPEYAWIDCTGIFEDILNGEDVEEDRFKISYDFKYLERAPSQNYCDQLEMGSLELKLGVENIENGEQVEFDSVVIIIPNSLKFLTSHQDQFRFSAAFFDEDFGESLRCFRPLDSIFLISDSKYNDNDDVYAGSSTNTNAEIVIYNLPSFPMTLEVYVRFRILPHNLAVHDLLTFEISDSSAKNPVQKEATPLLLTQQHQPNVTDETQIVRKRREIGNFNVEDLSTLTDLSHTENDDTIDEQELLQKSSSSDVSFAKGSVDENESKVKPEADTSSNKTKRDLTKILRISGVNDHIDIDSPLITKSKNKTSQLSRKLLQKSKNIKKTGKTSLRRRTFDLSEERESEIQNSKPFNIKKLGHKPLPVTKKKLISSNKTRKFFNRNVLQNLTDHTKSHTHDFNIISRRRGHVQRMFNPVPESESNLTSLASSNRERKLKSAKLAKDQNKSFIQLKRGHILRTKTNGSDSNTTKNISMSVPRRIHNKSLKELTNLKRDKKLNPKVPGKLSKTLRHFSENVKNPPKQFPNQTRLVQLKRGRQSHKIRSNQSLELLGPVQSRMAEVKKKKQNLQRTVALLKNESIASVKRGHQGHRGMRVKVLDKTKPEGRSTSILSKEDKIKLERLSTLGLKRGHVNIKKNTTKAPSHNRRPSSDIDPSTDLKATQNLIPIKRGHKIRPKSQILNSNESTKLIKARPRNLGDGDFKGNTSNSTLEDFHLVFRKKGHRPRPKSGNHASRVVKISRYSPQRKSNHNQSQIVTKLPANALIKLKRGHPLVPKHKGDRIHPEIHVGRAARIRTVDDHQGVKDVNGDGSGSDSIDKSGNKKHIVNVKRGHKRLSSDFARTMGQLLDKDVQVVAEPMDDPQPEEGPIIDYIDSPKLMRKGYTKEVILRHGKDIPLTVDDVFTGCGRNYSCFHFPSGCYLKKNCQVGMTYQVEKGLHVRIKLVATTKSYVAVGFSKDQYMGDDAVVICKRAAGSDRIGVWEAYNTNLIGTSASPTIVEKDQKSTHIESSTILHGVITCHFTLPLKYKTESDISIDFKRKRYYALLAVGISNTEPDGYGSITYHGFATASSKPLDFGSSKPIIVNSSTHYMTTIHICMAILVYGFFMPFAILIARYGQQAYPYKSIKGFPKWIIIHIVFQLLSVLLNVLTLLFIYIGRPGSSLTSLSGIYHFIICPVIVIGTIVNVIIGYKIHRLKMDKDIVNSNLKMAHYIIGHGAHFFGAIELIRGAYMRKAFIDCSFAVLAGYLFLFYAFAHLLLLFNTDYLRRFQKSTEPTFRAFFGPAIHLDVFADREQYDVRRGTLVFMVFIFLLFTFFLLVVLFFSGRSCNPADPSYIHSL